MAEGSRVHTLLVFLPGELVERLQEHTRRWPSTASQVVEAALRGFFERNGAAAKPDVHADQRGMVLAWTAATLLVTLALGGLGADVAKLCCAQAQLQCAADAAALSGATALAVPVPVRVPHPRRTSVVGALEPAEARRRAIETAAFNTAYGPDQDAPEPVRLAPGDVWIIGDSTIEVCAASTVQMHFAGLVGLRTVAMRARAAASNGVLGVRLIR